MGAGPFYLPGRLEQLLLALHGAGAGNIDWDEVIPAIKKSGYDSTITLEVFSPDKRYVVGSKEKVLELWEGP